MAASGSGPRPGGLRGSYGGNVEHGPHTLIAGETGSGKGVMTQNLLLQMIAVNLPDKLKIYLIDPKMGADGGCRSQSSSPVR